MKILVTGLLMIFLSFALSLIFPWWVLAPSCFLVAIISKWKIWKSMLCGFVSMFLYWAGLSWIISIQNNHLLAGKISILMFKAEQPYLLILITGLLSAIIGSISAGAGAFLVKKENRN